MAVISVLYPAFDILEEGDEIIITAMVVGLKKDIHYKLYVSLHRNGGNAMIFNDLTGW